MILDLKIHGKASVSFIILLWCLWEAGIVLSERLDDCAGVIMTKGKGWFCWGNTGLNDVHGGRL